MKNVHKLPAITMLFWLMKIIATTLGETFGDYLSMTLNLGYTLSLLITFIFFVSTLIVQLSVKTYRPVFFWLVVIATTTLGTEISDYIDRTLHLGYAIGSLLLSGLLLLTLILWYKKYRDLRLSNIAGGSKEIYFWAAVLFSNSLGTAFGDFLSDNLGLSYLYGALVTAGVILLVLALHYFTKVSRIWLFWIAFIFTRPFGATFGDFLTKPLAKGGLDLGTLNASVVALLVMAILIFFSHQRHSRLANRESER